MKLLKLTIILFCIAMLVSFIMDLLQADYEAVKGLERWMK